MQVSDNSCYVKAPVRYTDHDVFVALFGVMGTVCNLILPASDVVRSPCLGVAGGCARANVEPAAAVLEGEAAPGLPLPEAVPHPHPTRKDRFRISSKLQTSVSPRGDEGGITIN